jgi:AraC-like DNA-binding protein
VLVTWGPGAESKLHAHHCWHLIVPLDTPVQVRETARGPGRRAPALLTRPDVPHAVDARGAHVVIVFVEPESEIGERLNAATAGEALAVFDDLEAGRLREVLSSVLRAPAETSISAAFSLLGVDASRPAVRHPAIRRVLRFVRSAAPEAALSLDALAEVARLSPGRFMHAFTKEVGIPLRPYLRWLKLERAASAIAGGAMLSEAAHAAGFADAAHMTRTFKGMLGVTPSELRRRSQSVQAR